MLQDQGWSEDEGLGTSTSGRSGNDARDNGANMEQKARKRSRLDRPSPFSPSQEQPDATEEHILVGDDDDDDPIIEVRKKAHVPTIDLTQSDTEEDEDEDDEDDNDNDDPAPPASTDDHPMGPTSTSTIASDPPRYPNRSPDTPPHRPEIGQARDRPQSQDRGPVPLLGQTRNAQRRSARGASQSRRGHAAHPAGAR